MNSNYKIIIIILMGLFAMIVPISCFSISPIELDERVPPIENIEFTLILNDIKDLDSLTITTDLKNPIISIRDSNEIFIRRNIVNYKSLTINSPDILKLDKIYVEISGTTPDWKEIVTISGGHIDAPVTVEIYSYIFDRNSLYFRVDAIKDGMEIKPSVGVHMDTFRINAVEFYKLSSEIRGIEYAESREYLESLLNKGLFTQAKEGVNYVGIEVKTNWTITIGASMACLIIGLIIGWAIFKKGKTNEEDEI